jgi:hypothetical protein
MALTLVEVHSSEPAPWQVDPDDHDDDREDQPYRAVLMHAL